MKKKQVSFSNPSHESGDPDTDSMYTDDPPDTNDPPKTSSAAKAAKKSTKKKELDMERERDNHLHKEKELENRLYLVEQENIKLQLENSHLRAQISADTRAPSNSHFRSFDAISIC